MIQGTLEVVLVSAKGLKNTDFLSRMDVYAILSCPTQKDRKSTVATDEGSKPEWNETFMFNISEGVTTLSIKLMDKDTFTNDDFIGETIISLKSVLEEGSIRPISYNVVKDKRYCGEIRVSLKFTKKARGGAFLEENFGGWKESTILY